MPLALGLCHWTFEVIEAAQAATLPTFLLGKTFIDEIHRHLNDIQWALTKIHCVVIPSHLQRSDLSVNTLYRDKIRNSLTIPCPPALLINSRGRPGKDARLIYIHYFSLARPHPPSSPPANEKWGLAARLNPTVPFCLTVSTWLFTARPFLE